MGVSMSNPADQTSESAQAVCRSPRTRHRAGAVPAGDPSSTTRPSSIDQHPVGDLDGGETVGDDHRGPVGQQRAQGALHQPLGGDVERAGGLVEDEHGRVGEERPGEGEQLALAGREAGALGLDVGVEALGQGIG